MSKDFTNKKSTPLNDYHLKRNEEAIKAVAEMAKHLYTMEEAKAQVDRLNANRPRKEF